MCAQDWYDLHRTLNTRLPIGRIVALGLVLIGSIDHCIDKQGYINYIAYIKLLNSFCNSPYLSIRST